MSSIKLIQGDDSNALGERIIITLKSEVDLSGYSALFQLGSFQQRFNKLTSPELEIIIPASASKNFPVGPLFGSLKIFDSEGLQKTVIRNIMFHIEPGAEYGKY